MGVSQHEPRHRGGYLTLGCPVSATVWVPGLWLTFLLGQETINTWEGVISKVLSRDPILPLPPGRRVSRAKS